MASKDRRPSNGRPPARAPERKTTGARASHPRKSATDAAAPTSRSSSPRKSATDSDASEGPSRARPSAAEAAPTSRPSRARPSAAEAAPTSRPSRARPSAAETAPTSRPSRARPSAAETAPTSRPSRARKSAADSTPTSPPGQTESAPKGAETTLPPAPMGPAPSSAAPTTMRSAARTRRRAVIVGGARTPFVRAFGEFTELDTIDLGVAATRAMLQRTGVPLREIEAIVWGGVILPTASPNIAREIALDAGLPRATHGMTVSRACASGLQAITTAASAIEMGEADVIIAGGSDSTSNAEIKLPQKIVHAMAPLAFGKASPAQLLGLVPRLWPPASLLPRKPAIAERTTGLTMGQYGEQMARRNEVSREEQDTFAVRSHHRAARAIRSGRLDCEVAPVQTARGSWVHADTMVRATTSVEQLAKLRPAFARNGTLTAGNSTALTDGAAALLLMSEEKARSLGLKPLAALRSWSYVGVDPTDQLLMGPALAMPQALDRAGMRLSDVDLIDLHEAFAAQVLSVLRMLGSRAFAREYLGRDEAVGSVDPDRLNVHGGSVAFGHPFGATGARMALTMANELFLTGKQTALLGICAGGAMGAAAILERVA